MELIRKIFACLIIYGFFLIFLMLFLNKVVSLDEYIFIVINNSTIPSLVLFFDAITYLGSSLFWVFLIILFWLKNERKLSLHLLFALIINSVSLLILKNLFLRPRPFEKFQNIITDIDAYDIGPSFPSGHSEVAFAGAVVLSHYYKKYRILFYFLSILTAFSRIYIGVHYPLDVLVGTINGIIIGMTALAIPTKRIEKFLNSRKLTRPSNYRS